jgi:hypothetical protein
MKCITLIICTLAFWLVAASLNAAPRRNLDEVAIFECIFTDEFDLNYDRWPDGWHRRVDEDHPPYVDISIVDDPTATGGRALRMQLDGSNASLQTPRIPVLPKFSYRLRFAIKIERVEQSAVAAAIDLFDDEGKLLQTIRSERLRSTDGWIDYEFDPFQPVDSTVAYAQIRFDAKRGRRGDLHAQIFIDDITLARLPSMIVTTDSPLNVYEDPTQVSVTCTLSGIREQNPIIRFQLLDATRYVFYDDEGEDKTIQARLITEDTRTAHDIVGVKGNLIAGYEGQHTWYPKIETSGYYKIRVQMISADGQESLSEQERELYKRDISIVVLPPGVRKSKQGEFGWSMPIGRWPLSRDLVSQLVSQAGIHWLKAPVWFDANRPEQGEAIIQFAERLAASEIEVVGLIEDPTVVRTDRSHLNDTSNIASLMLADKSVWQPFYEHVMARLSLRIRWWQLGSDGDYSLKDFPDLPRKLSDIRAGLFRFGQDSKLGIGWRWPLGQELESLGQNVVEANPSWDFEQFAAKVPLSADGLTDVMQKTPRTSALRWVNISLGPEHSIDNTVASTDNELRVRHEARIREFVKQIITAKKSGADGIFISNVFTGSSGVMNIDGTPGELFLPWRTAASVLGGARYIGRIELPMGSPNHVFQREDGELVMVVWNTQAVVENLYLGESIQQLDVWGNRSTPEGDGHRSAIAVTSLPSYVLGLNNAVTRWRMAVQFESNHVPSVFAREHLNSLSLVNHFRQGVGGTVKINVPTQLVPDAGDVLASSSEKWRITPETLELRLGPGEAASMPFSIYLDEATYGEKRVQIDLEIEADRQYKFSVWRSIHVGLGDIQIDVTSQLDENGRLIVNQWMQNSGLNPTDFRCLLYAPPRRRKRTQVFMLGPDGDKKEYVYENGAELLGREFKLRVEEINGQRVLIHRFIAEP